jgi:aminopeptidase N
MPRILTLLLVALVSPLHARAIAAPDTSPALLAPGVSAALAGSRARDIRNLRYDIVLRVPDRKADRVEGRSTIRLDWRGTGPLVLDFDGLADQVRSVSVGTVSVETGLTNGHLVIPASALVAGENAVTVEFVAGDVPLNRNDEFLYTVFVPARARQAFPCFDQPDLKARFSLTLEIPTGWEAVSNGGEERRATDAARTLVRFAETKPLPTYLFAFAAGRLQVETAEREGRTFRMFHRETDATKLARNREAIFDLHASALAWLERYTGIPYPWGKVDFFLAPAFQFGGMEHAGGIFFNAPGLLLDESATKNQLLGRASLIAHEMAHMWFGDLVTMQWFDDVWMNEVFANFMAAKIVNPSFPEVNHELRFFLAHYPGAYEVDRTRGANAIRQSLDNLADAGSLYGAIIYQKAPIMMRQLELMVGEDAFRDGVRSYLTRHAFGNATWPDLVAILDERSEEDLAAWSRAWVSEPGRPTLRSLLRTDPAGRVAGLTISQDDPRGRHLAWPQRLDVVLGVGDGPRTIRASLRGESVLVEEATGLEAPRYVLACGGGLAYGLCELEPASRAWLLAHLPEVPDPLTRGSALVALWDEMLEDRVQPSATVDLLLRVLIAESDELNIQQALGYLGTAFWRFSGPDDRQAVAPRLERLLRDGLDRASTSSLKGAWFKAITRTATTADTVAWLERVWRKQEQVPGLTLAVDDYSTLALELAVREVTTWRAILDEQHGRIENVDRKARFAFVRPAVSAEPSARAAFFESLSVPENRRREPWVLEALSFLHHPLRAEASARFVEPSLGMLEEIKRTGDIFFPKRWLDATLGGHQSAAVADTVRRFLASRPDYPPRLRQIVLQSADELWRASQTPWP